MIAFSLLYTADTTRPAKISLLNLPQQALLEMLIDGLEPRSLFQKWRFPWQDPEYKDISEWAGVNCTNTGEVHSIDWAAKKLTGGLSLKYLPPTAECLNVSRNKIAGSVAMEGLPECLRILRMQNNELSGTIDLTALPKKLSTLHLSNNYLSGTLDFTQLPASMRTIHLDNNDFTGTIDLQKLPELLVVLSATHNAIRGDLDLRGVTVRYLGLRSNSITVIHMDANRDIRMLGWDVNLCSNPIIEIRHPPDFRRPRGLQVDRETRFVCVQEVKSD